MNTTLSSDVLRCLALGALFSTGLVSAQVRETPVTLALVEGGNPQGYAQGTTDQGVLFATSPGGQAQLVPYTRIRGEGLQKLIRFEERAELLGTPRALFSAGQYNEAAAAYGKVARDYAIILSGPQNFATEALFYQIESLKRAGQYAALAPLVNSPPAATILTKLTEAYKRPFEFQKLWALFGANDVAGLKAALGGYQEPQTGDAKLLKSPNFVKLPPNEIAQLAFLRAKVYESEVARDKALEDYYRSFTLAYGNDILLSKLAMGAAMLIQKDDPRIAEKNQSALHQMQSIAYFFGRRFGKDTMPAQFQAFAVKPVLPKQTPRPAPKEEEKPAEGAKPTTDAKGGTPAAPAEKAKEDDKGKDKGKAK